MKLKEAISYPNWEAYWFGGWPPMDFSYWEEFYTRPPFTREIPRFVKTVTIIWQNGKSTCYLLESEKAAFAKQVIEKIKQNESYVDRICTGMKNSTDKFLNFVEKCKEKEITFKQYKEYQNLVLAYYPFHIQAKVCVDYLPKELKKKFLSKFQEARVYAEPVFSECIEFSKAFTEQQSGKIGYSPKLFETPNKRELNDYFEKGTWLDKKLLAQRVQASAYLFFNGESEIATGKDF